VRFFLFVLGAAATIGGCNAVLGIDEPNIVDGGETESSGDAARPKTDSGEPVGTDDGSTDTDAAKPKDSGKDTAVAEVAPPSLTPIPTLRNPAAAGHPAYGATVTISGVVTGLKTAGSTHGFFLRDATATQWAAIYVYVANAAPTVAQGDVVTATGTYTDFKGFDELAATSYTSTGTAAVPAPIDVEVSQMNESGGVALQRQSMLVKLHNVTYAQDAGNGFEFYVKSADGGVVEVTSYMANDVGVSPFAPTSGSQTYSSITGHGYKTGASEATAVSMLAPRNAADVISP
jgi:predicted extracellular nuclease